MCETLKPSEPAGNLKIPQRAHPRERPPETFRYFFLYFSLRLSDYASSLNRGSNLNCESKQWRLNNARCDEDFRRGMAGLPGFVA